MFLTAHSIIDGYKKGIFPMAESKNNPYIYWVSPEYRGIINVQNFAISKSLRKIIKKNKFSIKINNDFLGVLKNCSELNNKRKETWINEEIVNSYLELNKLGMATSIESYLDEKLVGGLYGVQLGKIFFGESMFSKIDNASKVALVYLVAFLKEGNFNILDTQYITNHLRQFGAIEITRKEYLMLLGKNIKEDAVFPNKIKKDVLEYFI
tara:strand:+ start:1183 stop:1809 length:627 start_codon:yes stop_codon:yes gene_type:complete